MEWIAVNNKLPDKENWYIVYPNKYHYTAYYNIWGSNAGKWTAYDANEYQYEVIVTHYMALPNPPKINNTKIKDENISMDIITWVKNWVKTIDNVTANFYARMISKYINDHKSKGTHDIEEFYK